MIGTQEVLSFGICDTNMAWLRKFYYISKMEF